MIGSLRRLGEDRRSSLRRRARGPRGSARDRSRTRPDAKILVTLAERPHPFPSRTRKLSSPAPKILRGQPFGKIGRRQDFCVSGGRSRFRRAPDRSIGDLGCPADAREPSRAQPRRRDVAHRDGPAAVCPYLVSADGAWRAAVPTREHRCAAVAPARAHSRAENQAACASRRHPAPEHARAAAGRRVAAHVRCRRSSPRRHQAWRSRRPGLRSAPLVLERAEPVLLDRRPGVPRPCAAVRLGRRARGRPRDRRARRQSGGRPRRPPARGASSGASAVARAAPLAPARGPPASSAARRRRPGSDPAARRDGRPSPRVRRARPRADRRRTARRTPPPRPTRHHRAPARRPATYSRQERRHALRHREAVRDDGPDPPGPQRHPGPAPAADRPDPQAPEAHRRQPQAARPSVTSGSRGSRT